MRGRKRAHPKTNAEGWPIVTKFLKQEQTAQSEKNRKNARVVTWSLKARLKLDPREL